MVNALQEQTFTVREDGGDDVHQLGQVGYPHRLAVADEDVEKCGYRQRVRQRITLLQA